MTAERRLVQGITIDAEQTRDIDDAIWIEFQTDGFWHILVSIADVSDYVPPGGKMDLRAKAMVATRYFGTGNSPMLSRHFAEETLSLWPHKPRRTITVDMAVTPEMVVQSTAIYPSMLTSAGRIAYSEIPGILTDKDHAHYDVISIGRKMAMALLDRRRKAGALVLYDLNNGWVTNEEGALRQLEKKDEVMGHILIQEMMVLANAQVAEWAVKEDVPVLFRNHVAMSATPDRAVLMAQIQEAIVTPIADLDVLRRRTHMLLGRASYADSLLGHYGLNLPAYLHFTSPIRRYADLVTHRQVRAKLDGAALPYTKKNIEEIAHHINDVIETEREKASMHFKTVDEKKAQRNIDARRLDGLDAVHFERVTKVEARSGTDPSEAFSEAFLRRLKENALPLISLTVILTQEELTAGWAPLRQAIIDKLATRLEDAVSILAQAQGVAGWPIATFTVKNIAADHVPLFLAEAVLLRLGDNGESDRAPAIGVGRGSTSKMARQAAALGLLAHLTDTKAPELKLSPKKAPLAKSPVIAVDKDPVSALMEYVAQARAGEPDFAFDREGPDHIPTITCTVTLGALTKTAQAGSKQDAKKGAARALLEALSAGT